jgi:hypothetical protein
MTDEDDLDYDQYTTEAIYTPKGISMCKCHSYNWDTGETPEVIVKAPEWAVTCLGEKKEYICLDACIAETVQEIWLRGFHTWSTCCGHNQMRPSIVIGNDEDMRDCYNILQEIDPREWEVIQWQGNERVIYTPKGETE